MNKDDKADMMQCLLGYVSAEWLSVDAAVFLAEYYKLIGKGADFA